MRKFVFFVLVIFFDFCTKYWVVHHLPIMQAYAEYPFGGIGLFQSSLITCSIVHTINKGAAWGLFSHFQEVLLIFRIAITIALLGYVLFLKPARHLQMPLILIAAGALGNILDYFLYGHVIDMVYCIFYRYSYPVFNIADSAIFCSVAYLFISSHFQKRKSHAPVS